LASPPPPPPAQAPLPPALPRAWRPFNDASPWNAAIPVNPSLHPQSAQLIDALASSSRYGPHLDINMLGYSIPMHVADALTPRLPVYAAVGGEGWMGWPATASMPIPNGARPDPQSDQHLLVINAERTTEWGCFGMSFNGQRNPAWQGLLCATSDLTGSGVRVPETQAVPWFAAHGPRACGFPLVAGLIRTESVKAGAIDHALVLAYPGIMARRFMAPASTGSGTGVDAGALGLPCGARVQLDPNLDINALGLSPAGVAVARALQVYGAYVGDYSGAISLYAENAPESLAYWQSGVLNTYEFLDKIDLRRLRVLSYGFTYN
jgi:hypothetical protein